jgi:hypothetical protein
MPRRPRPSLAVRSLSLLVVAGLATVGLVVSPGTVRPAEAASSAERETERELSAMINVERAKRDLGALPQRSDLVRVARDHSARMARQGRLHHNADFSTQITGWVRLSENVGVGPTAATIHRALMASDGHRRNILDERVTEVGIGVVIRDGRVWVTQNFRQPRANAAPAPPSTTSFGDVSSASVHAPAIVRTARSGVTQGCSDVRFCPSAAVDRATFASMLARALEVPPATESRFVDVTGDAAGDIEALAAAGITVGCTSDRFCPNEQLSRQQLASLLARALEFAPTAGSPFPDVSSVHQGNVGALHAAGIVRGCSSQRFCAGDDVTRAQTATMLARSVG